MKQVVVAAAVFFIATTYAAAPGYHVVKQLHLGGDGSWDYLIVDDASRKLYVSHGTRVVVVDLATERIDGTIENTPGVHGIALAPGLKRGFISCGKANKVVIFDLDTRKILGEVATGENPDAIQYDPATGQVFVFNGRSKDATVINAATGEVAGTIALGGKPEFAQPDGKGKIYVNIEDLGEVVEIDGAKLAVARRFSISPGEEPTGMGFDVAHHRIFSGCGNGIMTVLDTESGKVVATVPIGQDCDGAGFDPATGLAFASNGEGTLTVVKESSPCMFEVAETVPTQPGARTMTIDPTTHAVYLPTAQFAPSTGSAQKKKKTALPDSFTLLVVGK